MRCSNPKAPISPPLPNCALQIASALLAIEGIHGASSVFELHQAFVNVLTAAGISNGAYLHWIPNGASRPALQVLLACDSRAAYALGDSDRVLSDPWVRYASNHGESTTAAHLAAAADTALEPVMQPFGFVHALIVPTQGGGDIGRFGLLCVGTTGESDFDDFEGHMQRALAQALAAELHAWWLRLTRQRLQDQVRLRHTDLQLLGLEREGLGTKHIARRLGLSEAAINSRFQRISLKMSCPSRKAAAALAASHGLL